MKGYLLKETQLRLNALRKELGHYKATTFHKVNPIDFYYYSSSHYCLKYKPWNYHHNWNSKRYITIKVFSLHIKLSMNYIIACRYIFLYAFVPFLYAQL